jgi:hypothetical protein
VHILSFIFVWLTASHSQYTIDKASLQIQASSVTAELVGGPAALSLEVLFYEDGVSRMRVVEKTPLHGPRWEVRAPFVAW